MKFTAVFAIASILGAVAASPAPVAEPAPISKRSDHERAMDLFKRSVGDESGELLKRQSAACWICLASCGFGGVTADCGCCAAGRACHDDCPE